MTVLIGIDEAGYGPNLGPLCVGASAWKVEGRGQKADEFDLYSLLDEVVCQQPDGRRVAVADSKLLYKPASHAKSSGLKHLERGVLTGLAVLGETASGWRALLSPLALPWYDDYSCPLPIDAEAEELASLSEQFSDACANSQVELLDLRARLVYPEEFNELTEKYGTKGAALSHVSIELVKKVLSNLAPHPSPLTPVFISCDKHGGRNRYGALLQHHFPEVWIETVEESRPVSRYRWGEEDSQTEITFRSKGEAELPVALASMMAKYHRELAMRAFNAFWTKQIPGLKPTAGYPQDAKRFKKEIAAVQSELGIDDHILWRNK